MTSSMDKSYLLFILLLILCLLFSVGCSEEASYLEFSGNDFIMDTIIQISVYAPNKDLGERALKEAFAQFAKVHLLTDRFADENLTNPEDSDIYRINGNAGVKQVEVSDDTLEMLEKSRYYYDLSGGAFDPSIGPVVDLWGFGKKEKKVPGEAELKEKVALVGFDRVIIDQEKKTVFLPDKGMILDLGGIAKGFATDLAVSKLREIGIKHALINAGGNIYALGTKPDGTPWRVGIQDPRAENEILAVLSISDTAAISSGDYERYFIEDNVRYHHIINPATGKPATGLMETTIVTKSAVDADILSTVLFVLGEEKGRELVKGLPEVSAVFVDGDRNINFSQRLEDNNLEFVGKGNYQLNGSF